MPLDDQVLIDFVDIEIPLHHFALLTNLSRDKEKG